MAKIIAKDWYKSKTVVANIVVALGVAAQILSGVELPVDPELQIMILAIINAVLRFATRQPVKIK